MSGVLLTAKGLEKLNGDVARLRAEREGLVVRVRRYVLVIVVLECPNASRTS